MSPYEVLGVSEGAPAAEVRSAYLTLVKKYHPDQYEGNPLADLASEKLKEINEAYDAIKSNQVPRIQAYRRPYQQAQRAYTQRGESAHGATAHTGGDENLTRVRGYLNDGAVQAALALLLTIAARGAEWHYLMGLVRMRQSDYNAAHDELRLAYSMEPGNVEYRQAFAAINSYQTRYATVRESSQSACPAGALLGLAGCGAACAIFAPGCCPC